MAVFLARGDMTTACHELNILIEKQLGLSKDALILRSTLRARAGHVCAPSTQLHLQCFTVTLTLHTVLVFLVEPMVWGFSLTTCCLR